LRATPPACERRVTPRGESHLAPGSVPALRTRSPTRAMYALDRQKGAKHRIKTPPSQALLRVRLHLGTADLSGETCPRGARPKPQTLAAPHGPRGGRSVATRAFPVRPPTPHAPRQPESCLVCDCSDMVVYSEVLMSGWPCALDETLSPAEWLGVLGLLRGARVVLKDATSWTQGGSARDRRGTLLFDGGHADAVCWCLVGALQKADSPQVNDGGGVLDALRLLGSVLYARGYVATSVADWNDSPGRTHVDVLKLLDAGIRALEAP
jgi:hypothetical protein